MCVPMSSLRGGMWYFVDCELCPAISAYFFKRLWRERVGEGRRTILKAYLTVLDWDGHANKNNNNNNNTGCDESQCRNRRYACRWVSSTEEIDENERRKNQENT
jgi:hypothetical protein